MNKREEILTDPEISFTVDEVLAWLERMALADGLLSDDEVDVIRDFADFVGLDARKIIKSMRNHEKQTVRKVVAVSPNVIKGIEFENHVFDHLKRMSGLNVLSRSADFKLGLGRNMDERSLCPDYCIAQSVGKFKVRYWLECKYRSSFETAYLDKEQIDRFSDVETAEGYPVFVIIGVSGMPDNPEEIYLLAIDEIVETSTIEWKNGKEVYVLSLELMPDYVIEVSDLKECILKYFGIKE